jgi:hypothetical protein
MEAAVGMRFPLNLSSLGATIYPFIFFSATMGTVGCGSIILALIRTIQSNGPIRNNDEGRGRAVPSQKGKCNGSFRHHRLDRNGTRTVMGIHRLNGKLRRGD